jgi:hypothetical protein
MSGKINKAKELATPSETIVEHLVNPFEDPQIHEIESILTRLTEDLTHAELSGDMHFECLKSLCRQSSTFRNFARLCQLRDEAERLKTEIAATRKAAKDTLLAGSGASPGSQQQTSEHTDTINL